MNCPICSQAMTARLASWSYRCRRCDYWGSTLSAVTDEVQKDEFLTQREDHENPIAYLDALRLANFRLCLGVLDQIPEARSGPLLEVGCGAGLFLECAKKMGFNGQGIEAYESMARRALKRGLAVRIGLFPKCLREDEVFGIIAFNDVLEHLPDARLMISTCHRHLRPDGLLMINIPSSHGLFFRAAAVAARLNLLGPWERMWQKMFWSPHLHYFSPRSLEQACRAEGFEPVTPTHRLGTVSIRGLWSRIKADPSSGVSQRCASLLTALSLTLVEPLFAPDCMVRIFRKIAPQRELDPLVRVR